MIVFIAALALLYVLWLGALILCISVFWIIFRILALIAAVIVSELVPRAQGR